MHVRPDVRSTLNASHAICNQYRILACNTYCTPAGRRNVGGIDLRASPKKCHLVQQGLEETLAKQKQSNGSKPSSLHRILIDFKRKPT